MHGLTTGWSPTYGTKGRSRNEIHPDRVALLVEHVRQRGGGSSRDTSAKDATRLRVLPGERERAAPGEGQNLVLVYLWVGAMKEREFRVYVELKVQAVTLEDADKKSRRLLRCVDRTQAKVGIGEIEDSDDD
jgi:hypothetical protein